MIQSANSDDDLPDDELLRQDGLRRPSHGDEEELASDRYLPARMINEAVYCSRLFYLMYVEGQFAPNAETIEGDQVHARVDQKTDALPAAKNKIINSARAGL